jgi:lipopolysaccharide/colanic/teichoic acid biosynthesis glycosyltransferase
VHSASTARRAFDIVAATGAVVVLAPLFPLLACVVKVTSSGPVLYRASRMGRNGSTIKVLKFRSMRVGIAGSVFTVAGDARVTRVGRFMRATKTDELPQLINVLRGDMSIVGPRPEDGRFADWYAGRYAPILTLRPGITSPASVQYRDEEGDLAALIAQIGDPAMAYREVWEKKMELDLAMTQRWTVIDDVKTVAATVAAIVRKSP